MDAGFQGGFMSHNPNEKSLPPANSPPTPLDPAALSPEHRFTRKGNFFPTELQATTLPFTLTLPGSAIFPSYNIFNEINPSLQHTLREFIALLYIWTRSLQINEISPACLALMAVRSMQALSFRYFKVIQH
jgi:hypothetical protein